MTRRIKSPERTGWLEQLQQPIIGFCETAEQEDDLIAAGVEPDLIYQHGRNGENLHYCRLKFRDQPGTLLIASGLEVLARTREGMFSAIKAFRAFGATIINVLQPDMSFEDLIEDAIRAISKAVFRENRKKARYEGKKGGHAKGTNAAAARNGIVPDDVVRRLLQFPGMTYRKAAEILGKPFSSASLCRHFPKPQT